MGADVVIIIYDASLLEQYNMLKEITDTINAQARIQNSSFLKTKIIYFIISEAYNDIPIDEKTEGKFEFAYLDTWEVYN